MAKGEIARFERVKHVTFQLDGHGEVFNQTFYGNKSWSDETDLQSQSDGSSHFNPAAITLANAWMRKLGGQTATHRKKKAKSKKDVRPYFQSEYDTELFT